MILLNPSGNNEVRNRSIIPSYSIPTNIFMDAFLFSKHGKGKQLIIIIESVQKKNYCSSLTFMWWCVLFFVCVFLHCNEQVAWMKCSLSPGVGSSLIFSSISDKGNKSC